MGHNGTHKDLIGQEPHHRWRKCCLTQLPFWSGPGLPASQMTQPKSEDGAAPPPPAQPPSPTAQRTPSYWAAAELFFVPWLLTVLVLPAPPWTLEGTVLARPRLWPLLELPSCRRALRTQRQPAGSSVSHGVGGDRVGQKRSSLGTLLLSQAQLLARYGQQEKASSSLQPSWQAWRSEEIRIAQGSLLSIDTPSNDLTGSPV